MIRATFPGAGLACSASEPGRRTISGVAVPYGVPGTVADGTTVVFTPGALDAAARPVVLRDHDRTRPIGVVTDATNTPAALAVTARISDTPAGAEALVLAADGALPMFSVGVDPTDSAFDAHGVLHVTAADWLELSLLTLGAYAAARVATVTATRGAPPMSDADPTTPEPEEPEAPEPEPEEEEPAPPARPAGVVPITAAAARRSAAGPPMTIRRLSGLITAARAGDPMAQRTLTTALASQRPIEAALVDVVTADVGSGYRPAYQAELVEIIGWGTPTIDALRPGTLDRGDYPNKTFNSWTTPPTVALQTAEKTAIASAAVAIGPTSVPVQTWAGGNDISQQVIDLGSPSFVEDYIRAAAVDYAKKSDTYAVTTLLAAAANVPLLAATSFIDVVAALVGALSPATTPPGGLFLAMAYDVGVGLIGVTRDQGPAFWDGNVNFGAFTPTTTMGGLSAFVDPNMPAGTYLLGHRQGATWYSVPGVPFNLRAINVANLGLDIAVYGYGALGIQYPGSFAKSTPTGP